MLHINGKSKLKQLKTLDWVGMFLFSTGLVVFLIGMNWGGSAYSWKSGQVLGALFSGFGALVAFCFWEAYAKLDYPLIPMRLFRKVHYNANVACASLGAIVYYANSIIWPPMVSSLFTSDVTKIGWLSVSIFTTKQLSLGLTPTSAPWAAVFFWAKFSVESESAIFHA
jgi:hypothetical protein